MEPEKWTDEIDSITGRYKQAFGNLSTEQLNWKPNEKAWSIAQIIDHVIVLNDTYYPIFDALRQGTYKVSFTGKFGFMSNLFGNLILKSVQPGSRKKVKTFPIWEPAKSEIKGDILKKFEDHQARLKEQITSCREFDKGIIISSPANKHVVYKLETAFDIIVAHEQRHFVQAKDVLAMSESTGLAKDGGYNLNKGFDSSV